MNRQYREDRVPAGYAGGSDRYHAEGRAFLEALPEMRWATSVEVGPYWVHRDSDDRPLPESRYCGLGITVRDEREPALVTQTLVTDRVRSSAGDKLPAKIMQLASEALGRKRYQDATAASKAHLVSLIGGLLDGSISQADMPLETIAESVIGNAWKAALDCLAPEQQIETFVLTALPLAEAQLPEAS